MITSQTDPPRDPFWQRALLAAIPAIATAVVVEIGITVREALDRRRKSKEHVS